MKKQLDYTNISPLQLGLLSSLTMLVGVLSIATMLKSIHLAFWLLCGIPIVTGLFIQIFVSSILWIHIYFTFNFLLCSLTFGMALWVAMTGSTNGDMLISMTLTLFLLTSAGFSGYQIARRQLNDQMKPNKTAKSESEYIQIAGRRITWSTINRIADRIAIFIPLFIAVGLNTGHMLSQQAIYWIFGVISLFFSVLFAMGTGGSFRRIVLARRGKK
ncbi:MAG: hypothetical protein ACK4SA_17970 [Caldilinea sp.]